MFVFPFTFAFILFAVMLVSFVCLTKVEPLEEDVPAFALVMAPFPNPIPPLIECPLLVEVGLYI